MGVLRCVPLGQLNPQFCREEMQNMQCYLQALCSGLWRTEPCDWMLFVKETVYYKKIVCCMSLDMCGLQGR